jgi:hypothetical protein
MVEFVRKLADYLPSDLSKIDITATDQKSLNLFALSTGAQEMNPNVIQTSPPIPSMLDLIKHVISINADVNSGKTAEKDLKDWERDGLASYPELVYYLQVRENFLAAMTIGKINPDYLGMQKRFTMSSWIRLPMAGPAISAQSISSKLLLFRNG